MVALEVNQLQSANNGDVGMLQHQTFGMNAASAQWTPNPSERHIRVSLGSANLGSANLRLAQPICQTVLYPCNAGLRSLHAVVHSALKDQLRQSHQQITELQVTVPMPVPNPPCIEM